jgi:hypothetical protein
MPIPIPRHTCVVLLAGLLASSVALAGEVVLRDDFSNAASGWPTASPADGGGTGLALYSDGEYQLSLLADASMAFVPAPKQAAGADVVVSAKTWMYAGVGGGGAGLACRAHEGRYYAFLLTGSGGWAIAKVAGKQVNALAAGQLRRPPQIAGMPQGLLEARCEGDRLELRVDGDLMGSAQDAEYTSGAAGLTLISQKAAGTNTRFDDFELRTP